MNTTPNWLSGAGFSADWVRTAGKGNISSVGAQQTVDLCYVYHITDLCPLIIRQPGTGPTGPIIAVYSINSNLASSVAESVDFEGNYNTPLFNGNFTSRLLGIYGWLNKSLVPGSTWTYTTDTEGNPDWLLNLETAYRQDAWTIAVNEKFIGGSQTESRSATTRTINQLAVPPAYYTGLTLKYDFDNLWASPEIYLTIDNLFDQNPRYSTGNGGSGADFVNVSSYYDEIGRFFTVGVKAQL